MLVGQYSSKLTDKDRISVPKKFRNELGDDLIIAKWYETCLVLVSYDTWKSLLNRLSDKSGLVTEPVRDIDRFIMGSAYEVKLDGQGRFIIPEVLRTYASIVDEATFVGLGDRVEIWSSEKWKGIEEISERKAADAIEAISKSHR